MMTTPFLTILENGEELIKSTLEDSYKRYKSSSGGNKKSDMAQFIRTTKFHVGKCYTLNEIIDSALMKKKQKPKKQFCLETTNRLMKKLKKFNLSISMTSNLSDQIYYLVAWIKGLVRKRLVYDSSTKDWHLLPFYDKESLNWALLAWTDKQQRPILYTTSNKRFLTYECVVDHTVVINSTFYNVYNPIVKHYPTRRKLFKIMQLAYNLYANNNLSHDTDVEYLFTLISFEEPYFDEYQPKRYLQDTTTTKELTPSLFDQILESISKGDYSIIHQSVDLEYTPSNYGKSFQNE